MKTPKKYSCRWYDYCMDCCRHPVTHKKNEAIGNQFGADTQILAEWACHCRIHCGYEKADANHPAWDAEGAK